MQFLTVAAATLPSVPLDFEGNRDRILDSIHMAKAQGAALRTGPEACLLSQPCQLLLTIPQLEIPGYSCLDHHLGRRLHPLPAIS